MLRDAPGELRAALLRADLTLAALAYGLWLAGAVSEGLAFEPIRAALLGIVAATALPFAFGQLGLYDPERRLDLERVLARLVLGGAGGGAGFVLACGVLAPTLNPLSAIRGAGLQLLLLGGLHLAAEVSAYLASRQREDRNVLIVGSGPRAGYVREVIESHPDARLKIVGFIDDGRPESGGCVSEDELYKLPDMQDLLRDQVIDRVIVACPRSMLGRLVGVVDACAAAGVPIMVLSDLFGDYLPPPRTIRFGTLPALDFAPVHHPRGTLLVKRAIDVVGALVGLVVASPVLALAAVAIKTTSRGPVFFRQSRCGLNGRPFRMTKLRTMTSDAEERRSELQHHNELDGPVFKMKNDPRITRVGGWLRRTSLDELPQLWDVLRGHMSLVGPRPCLPMEAAAYQTFERRRLSMRPGITCLWQVSGRNQIGFEDWVRLDLEYIDTWSLGQDLQILLRTLPAVLKGTGAH